MDMQRFFSTQFTLLLFSLLFSHAVLGSYDIALKKLNDGDVSGAMTLWRKLADSGDMNSRYSLGILYEQPGKNQSHQQAIHYLQLASNQGMHKAQYHLAMKYFAGYGVEQDFNKTIQLLLKAAAQDYPEAQYQLGRMASEGLGFPQDATEAIRWYLLAAENGFGPAQHTLASHYMTGNGTLANIDKAIFWLKHAVEQNNMLAQRDLGFLYTQGLGVTKDYVQAAKLLHNPAEKGSPVSQYLLGQIYAEGGFGLQQSIRSAKQWFNKALQSGYPKAQGALEQIAHLPSEPEAEVSDTAAPGQDHKAEELARLIDPHADTSELEFYDFYNEDLSVYRKAGNLRKKNKSAHTSEKNASTAAMSDATMSEAELVEYHDIDGQFDQAFSARAKSVGGSGHYQRIFGLKQNDNELQIRKDRRFIPEFVRNTDADTNVDSNIDSNAAKAQVFKSKFATQQRPLGFFNRRPMLEEMPQKITVVNHTQQTVSSAAPAPAYTAAVEKVEKETDQARFGKLSGDNFTLQILQSSNPEQVKQISRSNSGAKDDNLYVLAANKNNHPVYLVTYGTYADRKKAQDAARTLPRYVALGTPWIRKISKIQQQIENL